MDESAGDRAAEHDAALALRPDERRALQRARSRFAGASVLIGLVVASAAMTLVTALRGGLDPGAALLVLALCGWWGWLLRSAPGRWRAAGIDLARGDARVIHGVAGVRLRRGIGLLAPSWHELLLDGRRFVLDAARADALREGMTVEARVAPESGVLLSVAAGSGACSVPRRGDASEAPSVAAAASAAAGLSERESELLALIAAGHSDKEIARRLALEPATVRTYNSQLYAKLGARRRTEAVARARALGLLTDIDH